jgi:hypothetical protein
MIINFIYNTPTSVWGTALYYCWTRLLVLDSLCSIVWFTLTFVGHTTN